MTLCTLAIAWASCCLQTGDPAGDKIEQEKKQDVVLRALIDELDRGKVGLKLEDLQRPYFIEYALADGVSASATAKLGALTGSNEGRSRMLRTDVRVGSYEQDNTNYSGDYGGFYFGGMFGGMGGVAIPIEDDYNAIRQGVWWSTDRQYKSVTENYERKVAFMKSKMIEDKPADFSREDPTVFLEERIDASMDLAHFEHMAVTLSRVFRDYPDVQSSSVSINGASGNKYLINTEGTRLRISGERYTLTVKAGVQADDGMKFSDSIDLSVRKLGDLPSVEELSKRCRAMAERLIKVKAAPKLEAYTGPVLFDAPAAAVLFSSRFANKFAGGQRPLGGRSSPDDFEKKIGKRVLPRFVDVVDDPTVETLDGTAVMGHYVYDDQGVKAQTVQLVEAGKLKALVMSRNPSKKFDKSTGHGRGLYRPSASIGCLRLSASDADDPATMKKKLIEACEEEDLEFGIRVARVGASGGRSNPYAEILGSMGFGGFGGGRSATTPLVFYKVFPDGREELVRGAEFARFGLQAFKRILAAGDSQHVLNVSGAVGGKTVAAPSLLFEELDLAKIDRDFDKPPILPSPLGREKDE